MSILGKSFESTHRYKPAIVFLARVNDPFFKENTFTGRNAHLKLVPVLLDSPDSPKLSSTQLQETSLARSPNHISNSSDLFDRFRSSFKSSEVNDSLQKRNGCTSNREDLLQKTDLAMTNLLLRLDQVAAQCTAAQLHGGGRLISEEKFQVTIRKYIC